MKNERANKAEKGIRMGTYMYTIHVRIYNTYVSGDAISKTSHIVRLIFNEGTR